MHSVQKLYQNLGKVFYAVAAADDVVHNKEKNTLKKIVKSDWVDVDDFQDEYGTDAAYMIEIIFDWLDQNQPPAKSAFQEFKEFKKEHEEFFTPEINGLILKTSEEIAESFAGTNKKESEMISQLKMIL